ncbi:uncharacterized protein LOC129177801 isoform X2 [Dunckerocampus dactyliophorus]|nr:uncharacterized protein LOC129177801 isoform X2 [Dunckerocampus dactyliophorus]
MQSCALMNGPSWQASSNRMRNMSTNNPWQYAAHSNWPSSLPGQDGRGYHGVSHDSQSGSHGHHGEFHHNAGQNLSKWNRSIISQSDAAAHWKQTLPSWGQPAGVHSHDVVTDALQHRTSFYQNMTQPPPYPKNNMATTSISCGRSLLSTNAYQRPQQHSPLTPVVSNKMMYSPATCPSSISITDGRTQPAVPSLRRNMMDLDISQPSTPQPHRPLQNNIPEIVHSQQSELDFSKTRRHLQCQIAHRPQAVEPLSPLTNNGHTSLVLQLPSQKHLEVTKHQDRSSSEVYLRATKGCTGSSQGSAGSSSEVTLQPKGLCSGDTLGQTDRKIPETWQEDTKQSERTVQCLPSKAWTITDLKALVEKTQQAQTKSPATFDIDILISLFWKNDIQMLESQHKTPWYQNLIREISSFCFRHWTTDSVVLTQSQSNLNLRGFHVLQDGEKYLEPRYTSSWRNVNEKLDDIDKEFGFAVSSDDYFLDPRSGISAPPNVDKAVKEEREQGEQEEEQEVEQEEDEEERTLPVAVAHGGKDDSYSFIIQVLPQEEAKAIYESFQPTGDHPAKEHLEGAEMDQGDSSGDKDLLAESEVEMFFAQWKEVVLGCSPAMKGQDDVSHTILEDEEVELDGTSSTDEGTPSVNPNQSKDATPFQQDDQETRNVPQQRADVTSKASHPKEMPTFQQRHCRKEQRSNKSKMFCVGAKRLAAAREWKRARHSAINVPLQKKLKTRKRRCDLGSTRRKDSAKNAQSVELVLFGSARRRQYWTLPMPAPEVLSVSQRGMSAVKQRIYQEWSLPPTRIEGRRSQKRTFTDRQNSDDRRDEQKLLLETKFRKDNNKVSLKKWRLSPRRHQREGLVAKVQRRRRQEDC